MNWISNLFSRYWRNVHLVTIVVLSVVLIYGNPAVNGIVSDVLLRVFQYPFFQIKSSVTELSHVNAENERLREELVGVSLQVSMLEEDRRENVRLRSVLGFEPPATYRLLPAEVVSISGDKIPVSAVINRGARDSVFVNQPIINEDGLIGRISAVMPDFATVQLLTDPTNRVAARLADKREMGIAKYLLNEGLILDNFPIQGEIEVGDLVVSSGLGGVYPAGLIVGTVRSVERPEEEPFCEVRLTPAARFFSLDELFILKPEAP